jgi:hypothetical protein
MLRRRAPIDQQQLPGILVGGKVPGVRGRYVVYCWGTDELHRHLQSCRSDEHLSQHLLTPYKRGRSRARRARDLPAPERRLRPIGRGGPATPRAEGHRRTWCDKCLTIEVQGHPVTRAYTFEIGRVWFTRQSEGAVTDTCPPTKRIRCGRGACWLWSSGALPTAFLCLLDS